MKPLMLLPPVIFAGFAAVAFIGLRSTDEGLPSTMIGQGAPPVAVTALGDLPLASDADLTAPGVKLVNFWASWCQPCRAEAGMLEQLQADGVTIIGIAYKDQDSDALGFLSEFGNPFAATGADAPGRMGINWGIYGVPETFVVDGKGKVIARLAGPITESTLAQTIRPAMSQAARD
jgi:cytochrome c biogenesis protein CcmG/thiol:disulfide interchange protein DsbE